MTYWWRGMMIFSDPLLLSSIIWALRFIDGSIVVDLPTFRWFGYIVPTTFLRLRWYWLLLMIQVFYRFLLHYIHSILHLTLHSCCWRYHSLLMMTIPYGITFIHSTFPVTFHVDYSDPTVMMLFTIDYSFIDDSFSIPIQGYILDDVVHWFYLFDSLRYVVVRFDSVYCPTTVHLMLFTFLLLLLLIHSIFDHSIPTLRFIRLLHSIVDSYLLRWPFIRFIPFWPIPPRFCSACSMPPLPPTWVGYHHIIPTIDGIWFWWLLQFIPFDLFIPRFHLHYWPVLELLIILIDWNSIDWSQYSCYWYWRSLIFSALGDYSVIPIDDTFPFHILTHSSIAVTVDADWYSDVVPDYTIRSLHIRFLHSTIHLFILDDDPHSYIPVVTVFPFPPPHTTTFIHSPPHIHLFLIWLRCPHSIVTLHSAGKIRFIHWYRYVDWLHLIRVDPTFDLTPFPSESITVPFTGAIDSLHLPITMGRYDTLRLVTFCYILITIYRYHSGYSIPIRWLIMIPHSLPDQWPIVVTYRLRYFHSDCYATLFTVTIHVTHSRFTIYIHTTFGPFDSYGLHSTIGMMPFSPHWYSDTVFSDWPVIIRWPWPTAYCMQFHTCFCTTTVSTCRLHTYLEFRYVWRYRFAARILPGAGLPFQFTGWVTCTFIPIYVAIPTPHSFDTFPTLITDLRWFLPLFTVTLRSHVRSAVTTLPHTTFVVRYTGDDSFTLPRFHHHYTAVGYRFVHVTDSIQLLRCYRHSPTGAFAFLYDLHSLLHGTAFGATTVVHTFLPHLHYIPLPHVRLILRYIRFCCSTFTITIRSIDSHHRLPRCSLPRSEFTRLFHIRSVHYHSRCSTTCGYLHCHHTILPNHHLFDPHLPFRCRFDSYRADSDAICWFGVTLPPPTIRFVVTLRWPTICSFYRFPFDAVTVEATFPAVYVVTILRCSISLRWWGHGAIRYHIPIPGTLFHTTLHHSFLFCSDTTFPRSDTFHSCCSTTIRFCWFDSGILFRSFVTLRFVTITVHYFITFVRCSTTTTTFYTFPFTCHATTYCVTTAPPFAPGPRSTILRTFSTPRFCDSTFIPVTDYVDLRYIAIHHHSIPLYTYLCLSFTLFTDSHSSTMIHVPVQPLLRYTHSRLNWNYAYWYVTFTVHFLRFGWYRFYTHHNFTHVCSGARYVTFTLLYTLFLRLRSRFWHLLIDCYIHLTVLILLLMSRLHTICDSGVIHSGDSFVDHSITIVDLPLMIRFYIWKFLHDSFRYGGLRWLLSILPDTMRYGTFTITFYVDLHSITHTIPSFVTFDIHSHCSITFTTILRLIGVGGYGDESLIWLLPHYIVDHLLLLLFILRFICYSGTWEALDTVKWYSTTMHSYYIRWLLRWWWFLLLITISFILHCSMTPLIHYLILLFDTIRYCWLRCYSVDYILIDTVLFIPIHSFGILMTTHWLFIPLHCWWSTTRYDSDLFVHDWDLFLYHWFTFTISLRSTICSDSILLLFHSVMTIWSGPWFWFVHSDDGYSDSPFVALHSPR